MSEQRGNYRITVFSEPTPWRAGPVDISVFVQDAATGEPASGVQVSVQANLRGCCHCSGLWPRATSETVTNKLYYAAHFVLPEPGWYELEVTVNESLGGVQVRCEVEASEPLPAGLALWPWVSWPVLAVLLFSVHQFLVRRRSREASKEKQVPE